MSCCVLLLLCVVVCWFGPSPPDAGPLLLLRRTAQNFARCFPLPPQFRSFSLSGCLLVEFWWCFRRPGPQICTFGLSGCRVKHWRLRGRRLHTTAQELQTFTFEGPGASNTTKKNSTRRPPERDKKERKWWREKGNKSAKFWEHHPLGPPLFPDLGSHNSPPFKASTLRGPTTLRGPMTHTPDPKLDWSKLAKPLTTNH